MNTIIIPKWLQIILVPLSLFILIWFIQSASTVITLFVVGMVIAFALNPVVERVRRFNIPRWASILIVFLIFLIFITALLSWAVPNLIDEVKDFAKNINQYISLINNWANSATGWTKRVLPPPFSERITSIDIMPRLEGIVSAVLSGVVSYSFNIVSIFFEIILVGVIAIWMLFDIEDIKEWFKGIVSEKYRIESAELADRIRIALGSYLKGQIILSLAIGFPVGILLAIFGLPYAFLLGVWAGITEFIPYLGPILGAAPAVIVAFVASPVKALWVLVLFVVIQQLESNLLAPRIMGQKLGVHPLVVMFALISGGELAGILGMIVSVPLVAIGKVLLDFSKEMVRLESWSPEQDSQAMIDKVTSDRVTE